MMFQGTYKSGFYRAVRDLLHDQVSLQRLETRPCEIEMQAAEDSLARRWQQLLAREIDFRSQLGEASAPGQAL